MTAAIALGAGLALAAPLAASADSTPNSYALGQFLSGSLLGTNLDRIAALEATTASNNGSQSRQVSRDPLGVSAFGTTVVKEPSGKQVNLSDVVNVGAVNQYAQADSDGSSVAASGAVSSDGGVGAGPVDSAPSGSATLDLDSLLGSRFAGVLSDLKLQADAAGAQARGKLTVASGDYSLAGLRLTFTSPAIAHLSSRVSSALDPVEGELGDLNGSDGALANAVNSVVKRINPILNLAGAGASVHAQVTSDLDAAIKPLLTGSYGDGAVSFNLDTGAVSVDLAQLLGGDISKEPVGTEVLSDTVVNQVLNGITTTVATLGDQILAKARTALMNARVDVDATVDASTPQSSGTGDNCADTGSGSGLGDLVGGIVGGLPCTSASKVLPDVKTSLDLHLHGTVGQLVDGTASQANGTLKLLGVPTSVNVGNIVDGVSSQLTNHLLDGSSAVSKLTRSLDTKLVKPAVTGLVGSNDSVKTALTDALSVKLNNQDMTPTGTGSIFTETALRVGALSDASPGGVATLNLAQASVGPNVTRVVAAGSPSDPGLPGDPEAPTLSGSGSNPGSVSAPILPAAFATMAFTGVSVALLVAIMLALLAAGAYLVREGRRRQT